MTRLSLELVSSIWAKLLLILLIKFFFMHLVISTDNFLIIKSLHFNFSNLDHELSIRKIRVNY